MERRNRNTEIDGYMSTRVTKECRTHDSEQSALMSCTIELSFAKISVCRSDSFAFFVSLSNATTMYSICTDI